MRNTAWLLACVLMLTACGDDAGGDDGAAGRGGDQDAGDGDGNGDGGGVGALDGGSQPGGGGIGGGIGDPNDPAKWTLFVYGHADHNLSNSFLRDLGEMARAELSDDVRVIVLADFDASQTIAGSDEAFPSGAVWLQIPGGGADPIELGVEEELDLDDPAVLHGAIAAAFAQFPSEHRALVLWDHGGSWLGGFGGDTQDGTRTGANAMSVTDVASAVASGLQAAGLAASDTLDIFSFDTCLMSGAEVAWEFRDLARIYIANAELDYGDGWDYDAFLTHLAAHPDDALLELARTEVELWDAHHLEASFNDSLLRSHVALDMQALPGFVDALDAFVTSWLGSSTLTGTELGLASYFALPPYMNQLEDPQSTPELRDVGQFLSGMTSVSDPDVASAAMAARDALDEAIVARSQGSLREAASQRGMHIELPLAAYMTQELFDVYAERASGFVEASGWYDALLTYGNLNDGIEPLVTTSITNDTNPDIDNLPTIELSAQGDDIAEVELDLGLLAPSDSDVLLMFGVIAKSPIESNASYEFAWDGQLMAMPDGAGGQQAVSLAIWEDVGPDSSGTSAPVLATFGLVDTGDGEPLLGALLFQDGDEETSLLTLFDPPVTLPLSQVASDFPGSTFTPVIVALTLSTEEQELLPGSPIGLDQASIALSRGAASAGTYALIVGVTDVFGNVGADLQLADVVVPIQ